MPVVYVVQVHSFLDKVLYHLELSKFDSVVDGRLAIEVYWVGTGSKVHELSGNSDVALSYAVENWGLAVGISVVHVAAILNKELNQLWEAFFDSVVEGSLF